jgi:hypothetical protein
VSLDWSTLVRLEVHGAGSAGQAVATLGFAVGKEKLQVGETEDKDMTMRMSPGVCDGGPGAPVLRVRPRLVLLLTRADHGQVGGGPLHWG